jgi:hypothetical protein
MKTIEIVYGCIDCGSKKCKRGHGGACGKVWQSLILVGVWSQVVGFVSVHLAPVAVTFSHLISFVKNHRS